MEDREQRNAVFAAAQSTNQVPTVDRVKAELGLDIPVESIVLPTGGKVYPATSALAGMERVDIRAMTTREEDILTSRALHKKGTVISELIKSCLVDKKIDVMEMLAGDRYALMVAIRITGYGPEYDAEVECSQCASKQMHHFDLSNVAIKRLGIDPVSPGQNLFSFTLPMSKKVVNFKYLSGRDEDEIMVAAERLKKAASGSMIDSVISTRLRYSIVSVDGRDDRNLVNAFVQRMPARDSLALRKFMDANEPGVDMSQEITCSSCGYAEEVAIPINATFLFPNARR